VQDDINETRCSDDPSSRPSAARTSAGSMFQFLPDGSRVFRVRIDVHDFAPEELSVRTEGGQLVVSARQSEKNAGGQRRRQMTKTLDLPADVRTDRLVSRLANDGVLTVEAPADPPSYQAVIKSRDSSPQTGIVHVIDHTQRSAAIPRSDDVQPGSQVINTGQFSYGFTASKQVDQSTHPT